MTVREQVQAEFRKMYIEGLEHGSIETLTRLIDGHAEGPSVVAPETEQWAKDLLVRVVTSGSVVGSSRPRPEQTKEAQ